MDSLCHHRHVNYHSQVEEFKKFASNQDTYEVICSKVAPSIFGHEDVKKAAACLLFGGARKVSFVSLNVYPSVFLLSTVIITGFINA